MSARSIQMAATAFVSLTLSLTLGLSLQLTLSLMSRLSLQGHCRPAQRLRRQASTRRLPWWSSKRGRLAAGTQRRPQSRA